MSKTAVSELNARMSIDISQMEQAVPRATALLKRLSVTQAEAFAAQSGGPDIQAMTERFREISKSPGVIGAPSGETIQFASREKELKYLKEIADAHEESIRKRAIIAKNFYNQQLIHIQEAKDAEDEKAAHSAALAEAEAKRLQDRLRMDEALLASARRTAQRELADADAQQEAISQSMQRAAQERVQAREAMDEALLTSARRRNERELAEANAQQEAISQNMQRAAQERVRANETIADIRRRQAQVRAASEFERANPFQQQVLAVQELNRLIGVQRNLRRAGVATDEQRVALAEAELAVTRQIAAVQSIRDSLTAGTNLNRLGNTAADSQARFARFGLAMQQTGYQVQDFAVQVASGTNVLVAFSQQSSQLLGFFGGWQGAVAGAVISTGILAYRLYETKVGTEAAKKSQEEYNTTLKEYFSLIRERAKLTGGPASEILFSEKDAKDAIAEYNRQIAVIRAKEQELAGLRTKLTEANQKTPAGDFSQQVEQNNQRGIIERQKAAAERDLEVRRNEALKQRNLSTQSQLTLEKNRIAEAEKLVAKAQQGTQAYLDQQDALRSVKEAGEDAARTDFQRLANLRLLQKDAEEFGQQETVEYQTRKNQIEAIERSLKSQADAYLDQLDPLRKQTRELELIKNLQAENLLTAEQAALLQLRMADERDRRIKLSNTFKTETGASFAGMRNTNGTPEQIVAIQQQMLAELRKLVSQGNN